MKRIIPVIIVLSIVLAPAAHAVEITPFASEYIDSYNITVSTMGSGVLRVQATIAATSKMTKIGFPTISLYEWNGSQWKSVKTVSSQYTSSSGSYAYTFDYQGTAGTSYYAYASFFAQDNSGSDSRTLNSATVQAT